MVIDGQSLSISELVETAVALETNIKVADDAWDTIRRSRKLVERWATENKVIYGMTTGLGELSNKLVPPQFATVLSKNILRSHAAGVGDILPIPIIRAIMLLRNYYLIFPDLWS